METNTTIQPTIPHMPDCNRNNDMTAEDMVSLFNEIRPELFDCIYRECKLIYDLRNGIGIYEKSDIKEETYWENDTLNIAKAIVYDYGINANKIGKIIVAATE